jgi:hypothetical protein
MNKINYLASLLVMLTGLSACSWVQEKGIGVDHSQDYRRVTTGSNPSVNLAEGEQPVASDPLYVIPVVDGPLVHAPTVSGLMLPPNSSLANHVVAKEKTVAVEKQNKQATTTSAQKLQKKSYRARVDINRIGTNSGSVANQLHPEAKPKGGVFSLMNSIEEAISG